MKKCYNWIKTEYGEMCLFDFLKDLKAPRRECSEDCPLQEKEVPNEDIQYTQITM